jgi:hypothetical protein
MVVERNSLAAVHRMKGVKEETLLDWLREAAHKGETRGTQKKTSMALSGVASR